MKVAILANGQDTGGQGIRIAEAFARHAPDWTIEVNNSGRSSLGYREQTVLPMRERQARAAKLYAEADIVHLRNSLDYWRRFDTTGKPTLVHHHGSIFRANHGGITQMADRIRARQVVSTLDMTFLDRGLTWLPSPYNVDELAAMRGKREDGPIRIAYFPTSPRIKSAGRFMAAIARLRERGYEIHLLTNVRPGPRVTHIQWHQVLAAKARADILFDQVLLGYGNNAIESWCMGTPVVAGTSDPRVRALMVERFGRLPFVEATEDTIELTLERLIRSPAMRAEYAEVGLQHVRRWHDDPVVVDMLRGIYGSLPPTNHDVVLAPSRSVRSFAR